MTRGAAAPRDVDLLVVLARAEDEDPVRAALLDAVRAVEVRFQLAVHPVVMTAAELAARRGTPKGDATVAREPAAAAGMAPR